MHYHLPQYKKSHRVARNYLKVAIGVVGSVIVIIQYAFEFVKQYNGIQWTKYQNWLIINHLLMVL